MQLCLAFFYLFRLSSLVRPAVPKNQTLKKNLAFLRPSSPPRHVVLEPEFGRRLLVVDAP